MWQSDGMSEVDGKICENSGSFCKFREMCVPGTPPSPSPTANFTLKAESPVLKIFTVLACTPCQRVAQKF